MKKKIKRLFNFNKISYFQRFFCDKNQKDIPSKKKISKINFVGKEKQFSYFLQLTLSTVNEEERNKYNDEKKRIFFEIYMIWGCEGLNISICSQPVFAP